MTEPDLLEIIIYIFSIPIFDMMLLFALGSVLLFILYILRRGKVKKLKTQISELQTLQIAQNQQLTHPTYQNRGE